jgi:hypothetical protein
VRDLPDDPVLEICHAAGLAELLRPEIEPLRELVEQPAAAAEQEVDQVDPDFAHEPRAQELLAEVGAHEPERLLDRVGQAADPLFGAV